MAPFKPHRWIWQVQVPANLTRNEDGQFYLSHLEVKDANQFPSMVWCYDCEKRADHVFGETCEAEFDLTLPLELWKEWISWPEGGPVK